MKKQLLFSALALLSITASATTPPCIFALQDEASVAEWNLVDSNNDGDPYLWKFSNSNSTYGPCIEYKENRYNDADDWAISPEVTLTAGKMYSIKAYIRKTSTFTSDYVNFSITVGEGNDVDNQTTTIYTASNIKDTNWTGYEGVFIPEKTAEYNIGFHITTTYNHGGGALQKIEITEKVPLPVAVTDPTATAGENGALEVTLSWTNPSVNDGGTALDALSGVKIYRNSYSTFIPSESNLIATVTEGIAVGETSTWTDRTLTSSGSYYYAIVPFSENGDSPIAPVKFQSGYVGEDTSLKGLTNVVATAVEGEDKAVSLTWDLPTGKNGGYVNPANVAYKITRQGTANTTIVTLETEWKGELPYVDTTIPGLDSYKYKVYYIYNGSTDSTGKDSNAVTTGGAMGLPYSEDFYKTTSFNYYKALKGSDGTATWEYYSGYYDGYVRFTQSYGTNDAWLMTPPFDFEAGKAYAITFKTWRGTSDRELSLSIGSAPEIEAQTRELWSATVSATSSSYATPLTINVSVPADGRYYFGFHCTGAAKSGNICLDDISVKEIEIVPLAATDFTATAAPEGALKVNLKWTNPTADNIGNELSVIPTVAVYRGETLVKRFANSAAGAEMTWSDENVDAAGVYTYKIVPFIGSNAGEAAEATTDWVGPDVPAAPTNASALINEDGNIAISFSAPTVGVNGGYLDLAALRYTVVRYPEAQAIAENIAETSCVDTDVPTALGKYYYKVTAAIGSNYSAAAETNALIIGGELELPYNPNFSDQSTFDLWSFPQNENGKAWIWKSSELVADGYTELYTELHAYTPPFKAKKGEIKVSLNAKCFSSMRKETLQVGLYKTNVPGDVSVGEVQTVTVESWMGKNFDLIFAVPEDGVYYIDYYLEKLVYECEITKSNIEQTLVIEESEPIELPYVTAEAADSYAGWSFPGSTDANPWGYNADEDAVTGSAEDMWIFTPCFNGQYGYFTVSYQSTAPVEAAVYSVADKDADPVGLADWNEDKIFVTLQPTVGSSAALKAKSLDGNTAEAKIPNYDDKSGMNPYYIGFHIKNAEGATHSFNLVSLQQHSDDVTGVENVAVSDEDAAVYYDLRGVRVANPEQGRVYIRIVGSRSEKVVK